MSVVCQTFSLAEMMVRVRHKPTTINLKLIFNFDIFFCQKLILVIDVFNFFGHLINLILTVSCFLFLLQFLIYLSLFVASNKILFVLFPSCCVEFQNIFQDDKLMYICALDSGVHLKVFFKTTFN